MKITPSEANALAAGSKFTDTIPTGQTYVPNSAKIYEDGDTASSEGFVFSGSTLSYTFVEKIEDIHWIEFQTTVTDPNLFKLGIDAQNKIFSNTAKVQYLPDASKVVQDTGSVTIPLNLISKEGTYNAATETFSWTIVVNENNFSIKDAKVVDVIDSRLAPTTAISKVEKKVGEGWTTVIQGSGAGEYTYSKSGNTNTFGLGNIDTAYRITYTADLPANFYLQYNSQQTFTNNATLTGKIGGFDVSAPAGKGINVGSSLIRKARTSSTNYNPSTQEVSWTITVNGNKQSLVNAVVTDTIPANQELMESTLVYNGVHIASHGVTDGGEGKKIITFTFNSPLTETSVITFKTKVTDPKLTAVNQTNGQVSNTVRLTSESIVGGFIQTTVNQDVKSEVLAKTGTGYNYQTRTLSWKIVVNQNKMLLPGAVVTDIIPLDEQTLLEGTITIKKLNGDSVAGYNYSSTTGELVFNLGDIPQGETYTITFDTQIKEDALLELLDTNGTIPIKNKAVLTHGLDNSIKVESTGTNNIENKVVSKTGTLKTETEANGGHKYIDWKVIINSNSLPISDTIEIEDVLQDGLLLDTDTVKLYHEQINANGDVTELKNDPVDPEDYQVDYDGVSRKLTIKINPVETEKPYLLTFRTDVTKSGNYSNTISFKGSTVEESDNSSGYSITYQTAGGGASGTVGSVTLEKQDADHPATLLQGAKFLLLDKNFVPIEEKTTNAGGTLTFENLLYNRVYFIKEIAAPENYILNPNYGTNEGSYYASFKLKKTGPPVELTPYGSEEVESINGNIVVKNTIIKGNVQVIKYGESENPLSGAKFVLKQGNEIKYTSESTGDNGIAVFEDIPFGSYILEEITSPVGYNLSGETKEVDITEDGETLTYSYENQKIRGNVEILKTNQSENPIPLPGAKFVLKQDNEIKYTSEPTDDNGKVTITGVEYGTYILEEVKAPVGYDLSGVEKEVTIEEEGKTLEYTFENTLTPGELIANKTVDKETTQFNHIFGYTITAGLKDANTRVNNVTISDTIPAGLTMVPGSIRLNGESLSDDVLQDGTIVVNLGDLTDTTVHTLTFQVKVTDPGLIGKQVKNVAVIEGEDPNDPEKPIDPKEPEVEIPVVPTPGKLVGSKTVDEDSVQLNDTFGYTITAGLKDANTRVNNVTISDTIPTGLTVVPGSISLNGESLSDDVLKDGAIVVNLGDLTDTTVHTLTFQVKVTDPALIGTKVKNVAVIEGEDPNDPEKPIGPEEPEVEIPVIPIIGELITNKSVDRDSAPLNSSFGYIITVRLKDSNTQVDNVIISDTLPAGLTVVPGSITLDGKSLPDNVLKAGTIAVNLGNLANTNIHTLRFQVVVTDPSLVGKQVKNVAIVTGEDPNDPEAPIQKEEPLVEIPVLPEPLGPADIDTDKTGNSDTGDTIKLFGYAALLLLSGAGILLLRKKSLSDKKE